MFRVSILILCLFGIIACDPIKQVSQNSNLNPKSPFICLSSQSRCEVSSELGTFLIDFSGQVDTGKIKTELPFYIQLTFDAITKGSKLKNVTGFLEGTTMFMGKIPVLFESMNTNTNIVRAETLLASCHEEVMTWRLWFVVEVEQANRIKKQEFFIDFDSQRLEE
jgi:hypothetical protein